MSEIFNKSLAELDSVVGVHLTEEGAVLVWQRTRTITTWSKPEPWHLNRMEWAYLYSLVLYWAGWIIRRFM